ncbi:polysaccharide biosynthesis protein [candidate division TA06 bacterium]|uniref:Polysaccharide biosynthesis protein n=1 Tax=candidate division TA06 bacterium TaxID=2250710 RepID=A0A933ICM0_UNCT6|nr:polysaccharide biosynthesis protein [candidate division TA06 bacterium]
MNLLERKLWRLVLIDALLLTLSLWGAFALRFEGNIPDIFKSNLILIAACVTLVRMAIFWYLGVYKGVWRYTGMTDLLTILKAISLGSIIILAVTWAVVPGLGYPRSVIIIEWLGDVMLIGGIRMVFRLWSQGRLKAAAKDKACSRVLIVGAGDAGEMVARQMLAHPEYGYQPVGFVDDDPLKQGKKIHGITIGGGRKDIYKLVEQKEADAIVIAIPSAPGPVVKEVVEQCQKAKLKFKIIPGIKEIISGEVGINQIRDIELEDLLRRPAINVNLEEIAGYLSGKSVLVSGAGGSIGSELCRQIASFKPGRLLLAGKGENSLYHIAFELAQRSKTVKLETLICDVGDAPRVNCIFSQYKPEVVFHAAAHKHVPMMEQNPGEAVKNNIFGTKTLAEAALAHGAERFVLVSTDKAVNPTSVMGATKRISEKVIMGFNGQKKTKFLAVRFGNVLGSSGSVVPLFKKQIAAGGPVTVTHPDMKRYFMTIPEAVQLVIQAGAMGQGGEVFVLDMGQPVKIVDLARDMIKLSGLEPETDIGIEFTGLRQGEKLYEELLTAEEGINTTKHAQIFVVKGKHARLKDLPKLLPQLYKAAVTGQEDKVVAAIQKVIPTFRKDA